MGHHRIQQKGKNQWDFVGAQHSNQILNIWGFIQSAENKCIDDIKYILQEVGILLGGVSDCEEFETVQELLSGLKEYFEFYNFESPHQSLLGKKPAEIYWGRYVVKKAAWLMNWKTNKSTP